MITAGSLTNLLANWNFGSGDFTSWTTVANDPGSNAPTVETFSPGTGSYTGSAPSGSNNYYVQGASGDDSTTMSGFYQEVDCDASSAFTFEALVGHRFSDDGVYLEASFKDSGESLIGAEPNNTLVFGDAWTDTNGTFVKTSLRGAVDYDGGWEFTESETSYPVYHKLGDKNYVVMKKVAFGSDRWSLFYDNSWDFDDLTDGYSLSSYTEEIISTSGDGSHASDSLNYPQTSDSEIHRFSDFYIMGYNSEMKYGDNGNYDERFDKTLSISSTTPSGTAKVKVEVSFDEESSGTCYVFVSHIKFEA